MTSEKRPLVVAGPSTSPPRKKTCRCGSSEHSRTTSKKCPLYTPRRAKQQPNPPDPTGQSATPAALGSPRTIKCKLASVIRDPSIIPALEDANERLNRVTYEGAKVLQLYVLSKLEAGAPLPTIDQTFIRRIFASVMRPDNSVVPKTTMDNTINEIRDQYATIRPFGTPWTSDRYVTFCFINVCSGHSTDILF